MGRPTDLPAQAIAVTYRLYTRIIYIYIFNTRYGHCRTVQQTRRPGRSEYFSAKLPLFLFPLTYVRILVPRTEGSPSLEYKGPVPLVCTTTLFALARGVWGLSWVLREPAGKHAYLQSADCERNQKSTFFFFFFNSSQNCRPEPTKPSLGIELAARRQDPQSHQGP